ncbi:MAG: M48 family metallopeptidase [Patescibacteria group bacterium]
MYKEIDANRQRTFWLLFIFLIFVIGFGWILSYTLDAPEFLPLAIIIAIVQSWLAYYHSDFIALRASGAVLVPNEGDWKRVHRAVENAAIGAGLPKPRVYFIDDTAPNAFATGRDPAHAAIAVTRGLVTKLDKRQLEGVLAHEMSHIGNYDIRVMSLVVVLVGVIVLMSDWFLRMSFYGGRGRSRDSSAGGLIAIIAIVLAILSPLIATLIQLAVSRKREFLADATGALITRDPAGLVAALEIISTDREPLEVANKATAHLFIANPFKVGDGNLGGRSRFAGLFDTHPPIKERVARLQTMTQ